MERRDPLREMPTTSGNNEPQEATDDDSKQPDPVIGSSDNKENGFHSKMQITETDKSDTGYSTTKPKETQTRRSILKAFDPLCVDSPEKSQTASSTKSYRPLRQLVIEDSDESESTHTEVSDEETAFVDACAGTEESSRSQDPHNKNLLEDSLIKFSTPGKVCINDSDSESVPTSDVFESQPVLLNVEASTSSSEKPHIEKETICSTSPAPDIIETEIVSAINKKLSSDCDSIPARFRFTISETGQDFQLPEEEEPPSVASEIGFIGILVINATESSPDVAEESNVPVIENSSVGEIELSDFSISETSQGNTDCIITESESKTSINEPSVSKEIEYVESANFTEGKADDDINTFIKEEQLCETNKLQTEHAEKAETSEENLEVQSESNEHTSSQFKLANQELLQKESIHQIDNDKELVELQPERESLLEDKQVGNQEFSKDESCAKICEKTEEYLGSDCETDFTSEQKTPQKHIESNSEVEVEPNEELEISQTHLISDCQVEFEHHKHIQSEGEEDSKLIEEPVKSQNLNLSCESKSKELKEVNEENLECTELDAAHKEVEEKTSECTELGAVYAEVQEETFEVESVRPSEEEISNKTIEKLDTTFEHQKSPVAHSEAVIHSDETHTQDEEHHLDSGVDSIEECYAKSPSCTGESEECKKGKEDQEIAPDRQDSSLSDEKFNTSNDDIIISTDATSLDKDTKVVDEIPTIQVSKLDEPGAPESDKVINLSDNQIKALGDIDSLKIKMADLSEKLSEQQQENSDLKLQLNAIQQAKASLELEIRQKEEIIIKAQAEALKNEQTYKQELKQLREKLKENSKLIEKDGSKELEDQLKEAKAREAKAIAELNQRTKDDLNYQKIMEEYENTIATRFADYQKLKEEHETATRHLANIELAFSDVHQKYERTKTLLEGFKSNEEALKAALQSSEKICKQHEERYESLKAHAKGQIEKSNKEILTLRDKYEMDINKLKAIIKRLEIKCSSLEVSLQQKTEECAALSALCDEVTGKKV